MKENQNHMDINDLWNYFKNSTTDSIKKNIPTKSIGIKTTLKPCYIITLCSPGELHRGPCGLHNSFDQGKYQIE
jgi:hypothetical protein